jgi:hypothetical protein
VKLSIFNSSWLPLPAGLGGNKQRSLPIWLKKSESDGTVEVRERLGGLLKYYYRQAV